MIKFYSYEGFHADGSRHLFIQAGMKPVDKPDDADLIVFNGGQDIGTEIYGELPVFRGIPRLKSPRDLAEINLYNEAKKGGKFFLGICRGAQLLNCLNGGTLWQHVNNHGVDHRMLDVITGKMYEVTSTHHQMMRPNLETGQIIGVASESTVKHSHELTEQFLLQGNLYNGEDVEIVYYKDTRTLCVQGHPEYVPGSPFAEYVLNMVRNLMAGGELKKVA